MTQQHNPHEHPRPQPQNMQYDPNNPQQGWQPAQPYITPKKRWKSRLLIVAVVVAVLLAAMVSCLAKVASDLDAQVDPKMLPSMPSTPGTSAPIKPKVKTFMAEDGTYLVPENIAPGTYRNGSDAKDCYAARLKGTSGEIEDVITNNVGPNQVLTIKKTDRAVQVRFCGPWVLVTP